VSAVAPTHVATVHMPSIPVSTKITVGPIDPPAGVLLAIDGAPAAPVTDGAVIPLDSAREHTLVFSCVNDLCMPETRKIAAQSKDETIPMTLGMRPAILVLDGDPSNHYVITERPELNLRVGENKVGVTSTGLIAHVKELETGNVIERSLNPNQRSTASFRGM